MAVDKARRRRPDHRLLLPALQVVGLGTLWLIFSGKFDLLHAAFGAFSIALVLWRTDGAVTLAAPLRHEAVASDGCR